jgi:hypothetical protein
VLESKLINKKQDKTKTKPEEKSEINLIIFLSLLKNKNIIVKNKIKNIDNKNIKN